MKQINSLFHCWLHVFLAIVCCGFGLDMMFETGLLASTPLIDEVRSKSPSVFIVSYIVTAFLYAVLSMLDGIRSFFCGDDEERDSAGF